MGLIEQWGSGIGNMLDSRGKGRNTHYVLKRVGDSGNYRAFLDKLRMWGQRGSDEHWCLT